MTENMVTRSHVDRRLKPMPSGRNKQGSLLCLICPKSGSNTCSLPTYVPSRRPRNGIVHIFHINQLVIALGGFLSGIEPRCSTDCSFSPWFMASYPFSYICEIHHHLILFFLFSIGGRSCTCSPLFNYWGTVIKTSAKGGADELKALHLRLVGSESVWREHQNAADGIDALAHCIVVVAASIPTLSPLLRFSFIIFAFSVGVLVGLLACC